MRKYLQTNMLFSNEDKALIKRRPPQKHASGILKHARTK